MNTKRDNEHDVKLPEYLSKAYMAGWAHCHRGGHWNQNPFTDLHLQHYWRKGFDDCKRGAIDGPIALGDDYIEPKPSTNTAP